MLIRLQLTDECRFCQDIACKEDIVHLLNECPALERTRFHSLGYPYIEVDEFGSLSFKDIKGFITKIRSLKEVFPF